MKERLFIVDAFTDKPFAGNPAAVCILRESVPDDYLQSIAKEMNLPETAFLQKIADGYILRWFTPAIEVDLCGHATLASAHVLWEYEHLEKSETAKFHTRSGLLTATHKGNGLIELNFPSEPDEQVIMIPEIPTALGTRITYLGKNRMDYIVEVSSDIVLQHLKPNMSLLKEIETRGIIVTAKSSSPKYDFISRFFAPAAGIDEDPVTGSAHCCLAPYWAKKLEKNEFNAYQASERGGELHVKLDGDRVYLSGKAVTILDGRLK